MNDMWPREPLSQLTTRIGSGITPRGGSSVYTSSGRPFVRSQNVGWGRLRLADLAYITEETHGSFAATEIKARDVLLNITGASIGRVAVATERLAGGNVNQHVCEIRLDKSRMDPDFVCGVLMLADGQGQIDRFQAGGNRQGLNFQQVGSIRVPVPPLSDQIRIAQCLRDTDELTVGIERLIAKKQAVRNALLRRLIPSASADSGEQTLGTLTRFLSGGTPNRSNNGYWSGTIPWISAATMKSVEVATSDQRVTKQAVTAGSKMAPLGSTLLLVRGSALHSEIRASLVVRPVCFNQDVKALVPNDSVVPKFLTYAIHANAERLLRLVSSAGNTAGVLDTNVLKAFQIALPDREAQERIVAILADADTEIDLLRQRLMKAKSIKEGMAQQLLTGKTRLPLLEAVV